MAQWLKNLLTNAGDVENVGLIPGLGKCPEGGRGNPLQYSSLENPVDRGVWWATVHRVAKLELDVAEATEHAFMHTQKCYYFNM